MISTGSSTRGDILILVAALIWGVAFYFQKTAMDHVGPLLFIGLRGLVAAVALIPFALVEQRRREPGQGSVVPVAVLGGIVFFLAGAVQQYGIVTATVTNTGFLTALYVVATPFVYWFVKRKPPGSTVWLAVILSFTGSWALAGGSVGGFSGGDALVAVAVIGWAVLIVVTGESARFAQPLTFTLIQFVVVSILGLTLAFMLEPIAADAVLDASESILYVGLLSSALTFGLMAVALRYVAAPRAAIMLSAETIFAAIAGYALLGERLTPASWAGAALIMSAVVLTRLRKA